MQVQGGVPGTKLKIAALLVVVGLFSYLVFQVLENMAKMVKYYPVEYVLLMIFLAVIVWISIVLYAGWVVMKNVQDNKM